MLQKKNHPWLRTLQKKTKKPFVLFLDFDGTLVPIAPRPELALLDSTTRSLLKSLSPWVPIVLISGRSRKELKSRIRLNNITYVGNHGLEISHRHFKRRMKGETQWKRFLQDLYLRLQQGLRNIPGVWVEDKGITLSIHYRLAKKKEQRKARTILDDSLKRYIDQGRIHLSGGKAVWEVRPPIEWNKGKAVLWILRQKGFQKRWPLYIGDDQTDQDAMRLIRGGGTGIAVGPPEEKGAAHYHLEDPQAVHDFLVWLLSQISPHS